MNPLRRNLRRGELVVMCLPEDAHRPLEERLLRVMDGFGMEAHYPAVLIYGYWIRRPGCPWAMVKSTDLSCDETSCLRLDTALWQKYVLDKKS